MPPHPDSLRLLTLSQLAEVTGCARATVRRRIARAGIRPHRRNGRTVWHDGPPAIAAILGAGLDPRAEKARLDKARADMQEHRLAELRDSVAPREEIRRAWLGIAQAARTAIDTIPARATASIPGFTPEMATKLAELLDAATVELDAARAADAEAKR